MYTPALLTRVSMRPNRSSAPSMIRSAVAGSAMSPATVSTAGSSDGLIVRALATTAQPRPRYPATRPAPMPCEPPVTMATRCPLLSMMGLPGSMIPNGLGYYGPHPVLATRCDTCHDRSSSPPVAPVETLASTLAVPVRLSGGPVEAGRGQVAHLLPGDGEPDAVVEARYVGGRDGGVLPVPRLAVPDQHVGHLAAARVQT